MPQVALSSTTRSAARSASRPRPPHSHSHSHLTVDIGDEADDLIELAIEEAMESQSYRAKQQHKQHRSTKKPYEQDQAFEESASPPSSSNSSSTKSKTKARDGSSSSSRRVYKYVNDADDDDGVPRESELTSYRKHRTEVNPFDDPIRSSSVKYPLPRKKSHRAAAPVVPLESPPSPSIDMAHEDVSIDLTSSSLNNDDDDSHHWRSDSTRRHRHRSARRSSTASHPESETSMTTMPQPPPTMMTGMTSPPFKIVAIDTLDRPRFQKIKFHMGQFSPELPSKLDGIIGSEEFLRTITLINDASRYRTRGKIGVFIFCLTIPVILCFLVLFMLEGLDAMPTVGAGVKITNLFGACIALWLSYEDDEAKWRINQVFQQQARYYNSPLRALERQPMATYGPIRFHYHQLFSTKFYCITRILIEIGAPPDGYQRTQEHDINE